MHYLYTRDYVDSQPNWDELEACSGGEKPGNTKASVVAASDTPENEVEVQAMKPAVVDRAEAIQRKLMNNVHVYAIAEKYGIPELKELAKTKFETLAYSDHIDCSQLGVGTIHAVFESTPDTDTGLRDIILDICAANVKSVVVEGAFDSVVKEHGDLGLGVLREVVKRHDIALQDVQPQMASLSAAASTIQPPIKPDPNWRFDECHNAYGAFRARILDIKTED